jgi:phytoene synthase
VARASVEAVNASAVARLTKQSGTSFYTAFLFLPPAKRRAVFALYSFCRLVDDCVDELDGEGEAGLERWSAEIDRCFAGAPTTEVGRELTQALERYPMPRRSFADLIEGCRMDLKQWRYGTFRDLRAYCERVASAVGLAAIEIFGYRNPQTRQYATEMGVALQLTNILRDVAPDAVRGRLYLPLEDLAEAGVSEQTFMDVALGRAARSAAIDAVLSRLGRRARDQFASAERALPGEDRRSMLSAQMMGAVYREILRRLEASGYPLGARLRLTRMSKLRVAARCLLLEWRR